MVCSFIIRVERRGCKGKMTKKVQGKDEHWRN